MKVILVRLLTVLLFISCQGTKREHATTVTKITSAKKNVEEQQLNAYALYKLDDKYSVEQDSLVIYDWLKEKSLTVLKNDTIGNIFRQNGGGPLGAQWNPYTDLYIAISAPVDEFNETPELYVNGSLFEKQVFLSSPGLTWYNLSLEFWEKETKEISTIAIEKLYYSEFSNELQPEVFERMAASNYAKVITFDIAYKEEKITKYFLASYGE